jgi:hypothetical protein
LSDNVYWHGMEFSKVSCDTILSTTLENAKKLGNY